MRTILGIDPGLAIIGYGVIVQSTLTGQAEQPDRPILKRKGIIRTTAGDNLSDRLVMIQAKISNLLLEVQPSEVAIEMPMLINNSNASGVFQALGVIRFCLAKAGYDRPTLVMPNQMKKAVSGSVNADKLEIKRVIAEIFDMPSSDGVDDMFDAIGVAYAAWLGVNAAEAIGGRARRKTKAKKIRKGEEAKKTIV